MLQEYNKSPISLREGKVFIDGIEVMDQVKCEMSFTPDVWSGRQLGEKTKSSRWLGYEIKGSITRRRTTPWLRNIIKQYISTGRTPEFTIQGIMDDQNSDYYEAHGSDTMTAVGCVLTGDLALTQLDSDGEVVEDNISFSAKDIV